MGRAWDDLLLPLTLYRGVTSLPGPWLGGWDGPGVEGGHQSVVDPVEISIPSPSYVILNGDL